MQVFSKVFCIPEAEIAGCIIEEPTMENPTLRRDVQRDHQAAAGMGERDERTNGKSCVAEIVMTGSARTI